MVFLCLSALGDFGMQDVEQGGGALLRCRE
jgi:hypothetical protein